MVSWHEIVSQVAHSKSTALIAKIFGGWIYDVLHIPNPGAAESTIATIYTAELHQWVWFVFIILFIYLSLSSAMSAAEDGSWVKKEWSGMWAVIRIVCGMLAIVPVTSVGIVGACWFVIWLGLVSSGMADLLWQNVLSNLSSTSIDAQYTRLTHIVDEHTTNKILDNVFEFSQCSANKIASAENTLVTLQNFNPLKPDNNWFAIHVTETCSSRNYRMFIKATKNITVPKKPAENDAGNIAAYQKAQVDYIFRTTTFDYIQKVWAFYVRNIAYFQKNEVPENLKNEWAGIEASFRETLMNKIKSAFASDKRMGQDYAKEVAKYGWVSAGHYYKDLSAEEEIISWALNAALQNSPTFTDSKKEPSLTNAEVISDLNSTSAEAWLDDANSMNTPKTKKYNTDPLATYLLQSGDEEDPILAMSRFGKTLESVAVGLIATRTAVSMFSFIPGISAVDKLVNNGAMQMATMVIAISGIILGTVLPVLPSIFFAFCVISWFIYLLQMFIVAPFWLVANAAPEGDGFSSLSARKGFNNALFVVGFPIFAIGGMVASIMITRLGLGIINDLFYELFAGMTGLMSLPLAFVGLCVLYCTAAWSVITNSMGLVQSVPRTLLDWLSLAEPGLHPFTQNGMEFQGEATGKAVLGVTTAVRGVNFVTTETSGLLRGRQKALAHLKGEEEENKEDSKAS